MKINDYTDQAPIASGDKVIGTSGSDGSTKNFDVDDLAVYMVDPDNFVYTVNDGLVANNTTSSTTTVLSYGVNVISTATSTDLACKLPQPVTGKELKIVNMSSMAIKLFPSNVGGKVNNYPIDTPAIIPADGKSYTFICIENPLPGEWTFDAPATAQYDFGDMSASLNSATPYTYGVAVGFSGPSHISISGNGTQTYSLSNGVHQGNNYASLVSGNAFAQFKPFTKWSNITKVKVYTNVLDQTGTAYDNPYLKINMSTAFDYYDKTTGDYITNGGEQGIEQIFLFTLDKVTVGTPSGTYFSSNIGDPGTMYGEKAFNSGANNFGYVTSDYLGRAQSALGDDSPVSVTYPYSDGSAYVGQLVNKIYTGLIYPFIFPFGASKPSYGTDTFKFKVIIEYN